MTKRKETKKEWKRKEMIEYELACMENDTIRYGTFDSVPIIPSVAKDIREHIKRMNELEIDYII